MGITRQQALDCFASDDLIGIGMEADAVRRRLHPEGVVSYVLQGRIIPESTADFELLAENVRASVALGATGITVQSAVDQPTNVEAAEQLLTQVKLRFPQLWLDGLSATEIVGIADRSGLDIRATVDRLRAAGLDSLRGEDAGILDDRLLNRSAGQRCSADDWLRVHRTAHELGMRSTAGMIFGRGESMEQRVDHLEAIRRLQDETGGFLAFIPATFQGDESSRGSALDEPTAVEHLQILAISRMYLDNIENLQNSWETQGGKVLQMGLRFGCNDVGSALPERVAVSAAGVNGGMREEELRRIVRDAGFKPVQRDTAYRTMYLN